jgi:hypothetical protein
MLMIVPTRGRPHAMADLIQCFGDTMVDSTLWIGVDDDDSEIDAYAKILHDAPMWVRWWRIPTRGMVAGLNLLALRGVGMNTHENIGFMGDDHRPRTPRWDNIIESAIGDMQGGIAYGNDLLQGRNLPTHVVMSRRIVRALGHMAPRQFKHLYVDNYWLTLGQMIDRISYLNDVVIEHMHPVAGKAEWDDGYRRVNNGSVYADDHATFSRYLEDGRMAQDVQAVRSVL